MSVVRLIRAVLPYMRQQKWGRIINLTSTSIKQPILGLLLSNSLRSAVAGLTKTLSFELARDGILVNNVAPGRFDTERVRQLDQDRAVREGKTLEEVRKESESAIPLGRLGRPEEFANAVVFLASERASYITGITLQVDGGLTRCIY
jgi:3-oxoacyl-[acyl-carrier protein] reductase